MRGAAILLFLIVASSLLAGCTETGETSGAGSKDDVVLHTAPGDNVSNDARMGERFHLHDYWGGDQVLPILDDAAMLTVSTFGQSVNRWQFRPDAGTVVPLGTSHVQVRIDWHTQPDSVHGPPHLMLKTAADDTSVDVGPIDKGQAMLFDVTNADNDLPHQRLSAWSFDILLTADPQLNVLRWTGEVTIEVSAFRGLDIPLFPPHPDHWNGSETKTVIAGQGYSSGTVDHFPAPNRVCTGSCIAAHPLDDDQTIPWGTDRVELVMEHDKAPLTPLRMHHHAADTREMTDLGPGSVEGTRQRWTIDIDDPKAATLDGPYARQSLWEFLPVTERQADTGAYEGTYVLYATINRDAAWTG